MHLETPSGTLHFEDTGGEATTLVLTHGLGGSLANWDDLCARLEGTARIVRWDVPGFGSSPALESPTPAGWARALCDLLDHLAIEQAVICGISMGGVIAQRFALDYPERTQALVPISTSSMVGEAAAASWLARADEVERVGLARVFEASGGPALSYAPSFRASHAEEIAEAAALTAESNDPRSYAAACRAVARYDYTDELAAVRCPTLILQGLEDRLTPPGGSVIMSRQIRGSRLELIEDCGHGIPTEKPERTAELLSELLQSLDASGR